MVSNLCWDNIEVNHPKLQSRYYRKFHQLYQITIYWQVSKFNAQQWGQVQEVSSSQNITVTYPLAVTTIYAIFSQHIYATSTETTSFRSEAAAYSVPTNTSVIIRSFSLGHGKYWAMLCK